ncbi:F-box/kelch-repeat protein At1g55270-like [Oryza brachyantha]|uniref:F-box/kelch-repeat protein At1g55270-like n=1 Tax=Oryza brachyantha TaxID=4533 RepID=UPI001ADB4910|nr:F-box/kelch-repeat protein At1g55270-like [Oryza brachyantha]
MDRRNQAPLVDSSACLCRVERSVAGAAAARLVPRAKACVQPSLRASIHPLKPRRSPGRDHRGGGDGGRRQCLLIPGLPDDLAVACLIRVPRGDHWKLRLVCKRWLRLLAGNYFYGLRRRLGLAEQWVYAVKCDGGGRVSWDVLDPSRRAWRALPPVPGEYAGAVGFGCAVLGGCHLYLLGGRDPRRGPMRRVVFYSARSNRWHRAPDMLRRRHGFGCCVIGNRLYVAGGEGGVGGGGITSAEVFDPAKNRWSFVSDMAALLVPFVSAVHGGRWYVKGLGAQRQVVSQVYSPETDAWSAVPELDTMVAGWRSPSVSLGGRLYAADCKDGCRLRAYDEAAGAWTGCVDSGHHVGSSHAVEAAAMVALDGKLCVVRNDMSASVVDVAAGQAGAPRWETVAGKGQIKAFVTNLLSTIAGARARAKNRVLHCQVLEA